VRSTDGSVTTTIRRSSTLPPIGAHVAARTSSASSSGATGSSLNARCIRRRRIASSTSGT
jgi:hypothetical protein